MPQLVISNGFKSGSIEVVPHVIVDKDIRLFDVDTALRIMDVIQAGGVVDFEGGIEES